jgi:AcrR family transcriptional regulator
VPPLTDCEVRDPRMKRTRQLLQRALRDLLRAKTLEEIGVQDIAEVATVNRATFYDHYTDKFSLFNSMTSADFTRLLEQRNIVLGGTCETGFAALVLATSDYLSESNRDGSVCAGQGSFGPLIDAAVTMAIRRVILEGLCKTEVAEPPDRLACIIASAVSSATYGAVKEIYCRSKQPLTNDEVESVVQLVLPLMRPCTSTAG